VKNLLKYILPTVFMSATCFADKVKLLENNQEALQARLDLITHAKKEIFVEYYEVASDTVSLTGLALLRLVAENGVKVKILIDHMHNGLTEAEMAAALGISETSKANENIEIKVFNPLHTMNPLHLTYRNHDKLLNIDGEMMIVGGRNVSENYFGKSDDRSKNFKDADALIVGNSAKESRQYFLDLWNLNPDVRSINLYGYSFDSLNQICAAETPEPCQDDQLKRTKDIKAAQVKLGKYFRQLALGYYDVKQEPIGKMLRDLEDIKNVHFAFNDPTKTMKYVENKLSDQIMKSFEKYAKNNILIMTPYLYPTEDELNTLEKLSAAGVKIKIVTNSLASTDVVLVHAAYLTIKKKLTDMGIEIYEFKGPEILHCKGVVIDDKISLMGSFNFDRRSALLNREIGVRIGDANGESSSFTKEFVQFINTEIIANSVLVSKDKIEYSTEDLDKNIPESKKEELKFKKGSWLLKSGYGRKQI
jgi:cardiolipin synthase C